jgi:Ca-activated chloride channel family protein
MAGELNFTVNMHRPAYLAMPNPQQAYLLLEMTPKAVTSVPQAVNFCLVLDRSGSMAGEKLNQMKDAAKLVVDRLGAGDLLSVVIFDDVAELVVPAGAVLDKDGIKGKIDALRERGGTHMSAGMELGLLQLTQNTSPGRVSRMLLLTDGQTWEDQLQCEVLADACRSAAIPINVLGLGVGGESNWDPHLLEDLAVRSAGDWTVIDTPDKAGVVFTSTLQSAQGTAVTNASLILRMVEGVSPRAVWRVSPLISRLGHEAVGARDVQVFLGDIQQGKGQSILADLLIPPRKPGAYRLLQADLTYSVPDKGLVGQREVVDIVVSFTEDSHLAGQTGGRVMNIIERVVAHKLQTQALDEAAVGNIQKATMRLRAAATRLLDLGEAEMAQEAVEQAARLEQSGQIDLADAQKMRYATRRLTDVELEPIVEPEIETEAALEPAVEPVAESVVEPEATLEPETLEDESQEVLQTDALETDIPQETVPENPTTIEDPTQQS